MPSVTPKAGFMARSVDFPAGCERSVKGSLRLVAHRATPVTPGELVHLGKLGLLPQLFVDSGTGLKPKPAPPVVKSVTPPPLEGSWEDQMGTSDSTPTREVVPMSPAEAFRRTGKPKKSKKTSRKKS